MLILILAKNLTAKFWRSFSIKITHTHCIPAISYGIKFIFEYKDKAKFFNDYFVYQCRLFESNITLPSFEYLTDSRLADIIISTNEIIEILTGFDQGKSHGPDQITWKMIKLCGNELCAVQIFGWPSPPRNFISIK